MPRQKKVSMYKGRTLGQMATGKQDHSAKKALTSRAVKMNYHPDAASEILKHMSENKVAKVDPKVADKIDQDWAQRQLNTPGSQQFRGLMEEAPNNAPVYGSKENRIRRSMENNPKLDLKPAEADIDRDRYI